MHDLSRAGIVVEHPVGYMIPMLLTCPGEIVDGIQCNQDGQMWLVALTTNLGSRRSVWYFLVGPNAAVEAVHTVVINH